MTFRDRPCSLAVLPFFLFLLWLCVLPIAATCQSQAAQPPQAQGLPPQHQPVSLAHLYWHFLVYQNLMDAKAAQMAAQGQDGSWFRNHLQNSMGFSDADFAPIRASSEQLSSELSALNAQAAAIRSAGASASATAQLRSLVASREADINAEIVLLKQELSPDRISAFEAFITQFFSPKHVTFQAALPSGRSTPAAVQP